MRLLTFVTCLIVLVNSLSSDFKKPTVLVSILVRNKAHTLPYFLSNLERLNYPKRRISLWIRSDHNSDNSLAILRSWIQSVKDQYHSIDTEFIQDGEKYPGERGPGHWTSERFNHIINLREAALQHARKIWADYLLSIDCDVFLINPETLNYLVSKNLTIVAPMLRSDGLYSNFWHGMTEDYYYQRTDDYKPVLYRENKGCFGVPMVHSCVLIDLRRTESDFLTYIPSEVPGFRGANDDIIVFAIGAKLKDIPLNICNEQVFGFVTVPLEQNDVIELDFEQVTNIKLEILNFHEPLYVNEVLKPFVKPTPTKDTLGFDKVYMINLRRRPERRKRMMDCFEELGLDVDAVDAVDGKALNETFLEGIQFMPEFADPYHKRPMKLGEIGCFLSHYNIWKDIADNDYATSLVLEDDIRFEPYFRIKVNSLMAELRGIPDWDLVYFGRKRLLDSDEPYLEGSEMLVKVSYSYWTLGYALSLRGAQKLLEGDPLSKLVPVDEYLPIMFDKHPQESWKEHFPRRNLVAFSVAPLLVYPTHYTGEKGYVSDTEDSVVISDELQHSNQPREDL